MARKSSRARQTLSPPPPPALIRAKLKMRDRFGLPIYPPNLLDETTAKRKARITKVKALVADVFMAAVANLGRRDARALFKLTVRKRSINKRNPNMDRRRQLLEMYDREAAKTPGKTRRIAWRLGRRLHPGEPTRAQSTARYIRQAVNQRARERHEVEEDARWYPPSLLDAAADLKK